MTYLERLSHLTVDPLAIFAALVTVTGLVAVGSLSVRLRDGGPALAAGVGLGWMVLSFTLLGTLTAVDFRFVAGGLAFIAAVAAAAMYRRGQLGGYARVAGLALVAVSVLFILVSSRQGSEWDEFSHWLHAIRYLADHHRFPGPADAPPIFSCCAAYPYGWPLVTYLGQFVSGFKESLPAIFNVLFLALYGGMLAQLLRRDRRVPGFVAISMGVLFATLLSPTFVSKLVFSSYADCITAFLVGVLSFMVFRLSVLLDGDEEESAAPLWLSMGLVGCTLLSVKPANLVLFVMVLGAGGILLIRTGGWRRIRWPAVAAIAIPLVVYVAWRQYVGEYLAAKELVIRPFAEWNFHVIPEMLTAAASVIAHKGVYFAIMFLTSAFAVRAFIRCKDDLDRLLVIVAILFLGFNAFLFFTYISVFGEYDARRVASYWRYNTQLGLAAALVVALVAARFWALACERAAFLDNRYLGFVPVTVLVLAPFLALGSIRFDIDPMKSFYREVLHELAERIPGVARVAIYDPIGSGVSGMMAIYEWRGRLEYGGKISAYSGTQSLGNFRGKNAADYVLVMSGQDKLQEVPDGPAAVLLKWDEGWQPVASFPYPDDAFPKRYP